MAFFSSLILVHIWYAENLHTFIVYFILCYLKAFPKNNTYHLQISCIFLLSRVVFNEVVQTSKYYMRDVTAVESSWLVELAPHFYKQAKVGQRKKLQLVIVWLEPQLDCYV